jgi:CO dehydrogenase maturation factor
MKIAVTGKGGTGKTTVAGLLAHWFARDGYRVLAVDADPDANLASALGIPEAEVAGIAPISKERDLIKERTGATPRQYGQLFKLNPSVKDIPDKYSVDFQGIKLLVLGAVQKGGGGCACPENVLLRNLLSEIILHRKEVVIVDMEAGIEHLGRATAKAVDRMLIVVEPSSRSISTAKTIMKLAADIGIKSFGIIGNKVRNKDQTLWIQRQFSANQILGLISYSEIIQEADWKQQPLVEILDKKLKREFEAIYKGCLSQ